MHSSGHSAQPGEDAASQGGVSPPLIELRDLGVYFQLQTRRVRLKERLLKGVRGRSAPLLWALRHVNLDCHEGEVLGIVGHNGAGKSTLCMVLTKILSADEGYAVVRGKVSTVLSLRAGMNKDLSGRANIQLFASFLGIPRKRIARQMKEIIDFSELGHFIDEPVRTYSSGMRARLAFSVATALEPEILILDEIVSVGDSSFREKSRKRIKEMMRESKLIVVVSHSTEFLREICTHCLWMERGQVRMHGPADAVLNEYDASSGDQRERLAAMPPPLESVGSVFNGIGTWFARASRLATAWLETPHRIRRCFRDITRRKDLHLLAVNGNATQRQIVFDVEAERFVALTSLNPGAVERVQQVLTACAESDVPGPKWLAGEASFASLLKFSAYRAAWSYVEANALAEACDISQLAMIGGAVARWHSIAPSDKTESIPVAVALRQLLHRWREMIGALSSMDDFPRPVATQKLLAWISRHGEPLASMTTPRLVHGKLHSANIIITSDRATIVDPSAAYFGNPAFEFSQALWDFCGNEAARREAIRKAYHATAPKHLTEWLDQHAGLAMIIGQLEAAAMYLDSGRRQSYFGSRAVARRRKQLALSAWHRFQKSVETFNQAPAELDPLLARFVEWTNDPQAKLVDPDDPLVNETFDHHGRRRGAAHNHRLSRPSSRTLWLSRLIYAYRHDHLRAIHRPYLVTLERLIDGWTYDLMRLLRPSYTLQQLRQNFGRRRIEKYQRCPVCREKSARYQPLFRPKAPPELAGKGGRYRVVRCMHCDALIRNPALDPMALDKQVRRRHKSAGASEARRRLAMHRLDVKAFSALLDNGAGKKLLDYNCGFGTFLTLASRRGFEVYGVEPSNATANRARLRTGISTIFPGYIRENPELRNTKFDVITAWDALGQLCEPRRVLKRLRSMLAENGVLLLTVPNADSLLLRRFREKWKGFGPAEQVFFSKSTLERAVRAAGFSRIEFLPWFGHSIEAGTSALDPESIEKLKRANLRTSGGDYLRAIVYP